MKKIQVQTADQSQMTCVVGEPQSSPRAGLILLPEAFGVNLHIQDLVKRFANEGFLTIAPELYHRTAPSGWTCGYGEFHLVSPHLSAVNEAGITADVEACFDWLKSKGVNAVASIGYCLGGRASFVANSKVSLKAAISYYGGAIAPQYLHLAEKQNAPILFFWGGKDKHIPPEQIRTVTDALTKVGKSFVNIEISDADHGFFCDQRPAFNRKAADLSWTTSLQFLKQHLVD